MLLLFYYLDPMKTITGCLIILLAFSMAARAQKKRHKKEPESYFASLESVFQSYNGRPMPAFSFMLSNGKRVTSANTKGKVVLIDLWFEACHPCHAAFGPLNELYDSLRRQRDVLFFSIAREPQNRIKELVRKYRLTYPMTAAEDSVCSRFTMGFGFPTLLLADKQGNIACFRSGGEMDSAASRAEIMGTLYPKIVTLLR